MSSLLRLLHYSRQSTRFIQSVMLVFVLSLGVAIAAPAVQASNLSPDQQIICVGTGGMKVITFAADGSAQVADTDHGLDCSMCGTMPIAVSRSHVQQGLQVLRFEQPLWISSATHQIFQSRAPPARAPPVI